MATMAASGYPVGLDVDGPAAQNRLSVLLRLIFAIPHVIVLYILLLVAEIVVFISWWVILFTGKLPAGMANFVANVLQWGARVGGYYALLTDKYPPFAMGEDSSYPVRLSITPQLEGRNRLTVFFRILMVIPQAIVLYIVTLVAEILVFISWIVALFTGTVPAGMHNFIAGWLRWELRVNAYMLLLTDQYPPFSLN
jgi:hypothetical protein